MSMMMQTARAPFRADASQGDPGIFDSFRRVLGVGARTALGLTGFGGAGAALGAAVSGSRGRPSMGPPHHVVVARPGIVGAAQRFFPGGQTGLMVQNGSGLACATGFRPNKTSYWLKDGTHVEAGSRCVRRRQMNPLNPRAMSRSFRRIDGGKRFQNKMSEVSTGKYTASGKRKSCR
jgi:hypothetical protein